MPVSAADIALATRLADAAGAVIRPYFRAEHGLELKADHSPVTLADREAEAAMRRLIEAERSGDGIVGEEYGEKPGVTGGNGCSTRSTGREASRRVGRSSAR